LAGFSAGGVFSLATAGELERLGRTVSLICMIETPVGVLDLDCPRELVLNNLVAEIYDHLMGESAFPYQREAGDLSGSMMKLAKSIVVETNEASRLSLALDWLAEHGVEIDGSTNSRGKRSLELFIRHANLIDIKNLEPLHAPVWLCRAKASWLTNEPISKEICDRITRGGVTEELIEGRHFEVMHLPQVSALAERLAGALAKSEEDCAVGLSTPQ
jgi:thioesterase domain-containing protein